MSFLRTAAAAAFAFATLAPMAQAQEMTDAEREAFRAEVRAYLLDNPEVLMEAIGVLEGRDRAAQANADVALAQANLAALQDDGVSWAGGNLEGDVVIVEFMDYRCSYCRRAFAEVEELIGTDGNIRFVVKEFPILGPQSELGAQFAIATKIVAGDDAYKSVHDALMTLEGDITEPTLLRLAEGLGLDGRAILDESQSDAVAQVIADTAALAQALAITGTPTFVMGDQMLRGYVPLQQMEYIVEGLRAEG